MIVRFDCLKAQSISLFPGLWIAAHVTHFVERLKKVWCCSGEWLFRQLEDQPSPSQALWVKTEVDVTNKTKLHQITHIVAQQSSS